MEKLPKLLEERILKDEFETWNIKKQSKSYCYWLDFDWCNYRKEKCSFDICPIKIKGSHVMTDTYGKIVKKISK